MHPPYLTVFLLPLLALSSPTSPSNAYSLSKRWTCGGTPPAFSCEPTAGCKNETAWGECAYERGLNKCGDPLPDQNTPVSKCQGDAFGTCETDFC
ncbi:hypothetical protein K458DRAFT_436583 [Lentithecium fluviatile CBS 122367]|uniref:Uncharacterized protein n=1 Tax=Lentithecium fluviatile CBS 122367 TaxID=1168545 RepID=A0A6G1IHE2_9PLEO|nr:hypothetical protein K458DRAFT_436583 [Lentithecium fluviatile CBS 122367]